MFRALLFTVALIVLAFPRLADACSCVRTSSCQRFATAEAVFVADVVDVDEGATGPKRSRMRVVRAYKGLATPGHVVAVTLPRGSSASCSLDLRAGDRYVIYASSGADGFSTGLCMGSYGLPKDAPLPELPPPGGVVTGRLVRYDSSSAGRFEPQPIAGVPLWIVTPDGRVEAKTDAEGHFRLANVPPGAWTVHFDVGPGEKAEARAHLRSAEDCAEVYASPRPAGRLIGSVFDDTGRPVAGARISITRANAAPDAYGGLTESGPSGSFSITGLAPGQYVVAAGLPGWPSAKFPFMPVFHPGVADRADARPVDIGADTVYLPAIRVQTRVALLPITADVVCRDGSRPIEAFITAQRLPAADAFGPKEYSSGKGSDGRYLVRVVRGHRYAVRGEVVVKEPMREGGYGTYSRPTPPIEVDPESPPPRLQLVSELERCQQEGGVEVPARWR